LIFAGPIILKSVISSYSNNQIVASSITVTPKLDIKIGRLDYDLKGVDGQTTQTGFSRSISVLWSVIGDEPFLNVKIGPTFVKNTLFADYLTFNTPPFSEINFKEILLNAKIGNFEVPSFLKSDILHAKAVYRPKKRLLSNVSFEMPFAGTDALGAWVFSGISAKIDEIYVGLPVNRQNAKIFVSANKTENKSRKMNLLDFKGFLNLLNGELKFQFDAKEFELAEPKYVVQGFTIMGAFEQSGSLKNMQLEFPAKNVKTGVQNEQNITLNVRKVEATEYDLKVRGKMEPIDILFGDNFIGNLPASEFKIDSRLNTHSSKFNAISNIVLRNVDLPSVIGNGEINVNLDNDTKILDCLEVGCSSSQIAFYYKIEAGTEWLVGTSTCHSAPCSLSAASHQVKTSNTGEIFSFINRTKILNPLYSLYAYSIISSGKKLKLGHEIKIN
jgi:hypothetical protein